MDKDFEAKRKEFMKLQEQKRSDICDTHNKVFNFVRDKYELQQKMISNDIEDNIIEKKAGHRLLNKKDDEYRSFEKKIKNEFYLSISQLDKEERQFNREHRTFDIYQSISDFEKEIETQV